MIEPTNLTQDEIATLVASVQPPTPLMSGPALLDMRIVRAVEAIVKARETTARADGWREGYGAGQRTDIAAETQTPNPYEDPS
jgi:hypothetical protein